MSAIEALVNSTIGFGISWLMTYYTLPYWGFEPSGSESFGITAMFFCTSFLKSWATRVAFKKINARLEKCGFTQQDMQK